MILGIRKLEILPQSVVLASLKALNSSVSAFNVKIEASEEYCIDFAAAIFTVQRIFSEEFQKKIAVLSTRACTGPLRPRRIIGKPPKEGLWWAQAAFDLGKSMGFLLVRVNEEALHLFTDYVNAKDLAAPPRVLPAIKRKRGEGSVAWLSRRHGSHDFFIVPTFLDPVIRIEAHLNGHKMPEMDWAIGRAIAVSEYDSVRDTWEAWHASPDAFFDEIALRGKTTILSPQILENPNKDFVRLHKLDDAFRGRVYSLTLSHMVWLHASELFEDLFKMGLTTSAQIERAYKKDRHLMLRLIACFAKMEGLALHLWSNMKQVISASPNVAPCFVRQRSYKGTPMISLDPSAAGKAAQRRLNELERHVVGIIIKDTRFPFPLCDLWIKALAADPHAADQFDGRTFEVISEVAIVHEFVMQMELSTFGKGLMACANALKGTEDDFWAAMCPFKPPKTLTETNHTSGWGLAYSAMHAVSDTWRDIAWRLNMQGVQGPNGLLARIERKDYLSPEMFDEMWYTYDLVLWVRSEPYTLEKWHRELARHFGLYEATDPARPTCTRRLLREHFNRVSEAQVQETARRQTAEKILSSSINIVPVSQTVAQSGHSYLAETASVTNEKTETRKAGRAETLPAPTDTLNEDDVEDRDVPEFLPSGYKLGKKVLKVFHRILDDDDETSDENNPSLTKGQIRWDVFEKVHNIIHDFERKTWQVYSPGYEKNRVWCMPNSGVIRAL
ncbi:hypothetical protein B0H16DRAFT_1696640 [Mycena metata]|uniref:Uncharacterized protein n=1 Tax=Mycena metata TaxID=1033252 RepID=A0AAD7HZE6_9AGAR|nr:hypothetical protein B0H16DRAFT_1696640 [Mycena metata]